jgi:LacI family transcriptional regulator
MKKVILMIDISRASGRQFLKGIEQYIHTQESWDVYIRPPDYISEGKMNFRKWIHQNHIDGIMVRDTPYLQNILKLDIPKIVFGSKQEIFPGIVTITSDCYGISKMAAEHFIGLGFRNFAYCGFGNLPWSKARQDAYEEILRQNKNFHFFNYNCRHGMDDTAAEKRNISEWLKILAKPLCVFACNDERGVYILEACKIAGLKVPEEIAVLGVDNDELICKLSSPPLSSIKVSFEKAGFEAAEALDKQMNSKKSIANISLKTIANNTITATAQYLVKRQSSDVIAIEDTDITKALIFIRENYRRPIQVGNVVEATTCSRRMLEKRFRSTLNRSINDEINRLRIEYVKLKLTNSHLPIYKIVDSLQFTNAEHFSRFFKKFTSVSPKDYRRSLGNI